MGGLGLSHIAKAVVFEEAGYSNLGPTALNIHAPDEGNIHLMEEVATPAQKERWLRPQVAGLTRSCFAMTEPDPGAGADPSMLTTTAVREGGDYLITGRQMVHHRGRRGGLRHRHGAHGRRHSHHVFDRHGQRAGITAGAQHGR